jgi:hypothetical protein
VDVEPRFCQGLLVQQCRPGAVLLGLRGCRWAEAAPRGRCRLDGGSRHPRSERQGRIRGHSIQAVARLEVLCDVISFLPFCFHGERWCKNAFLHFFSAC